CAILAGTTLYNSLDVW
nr:immunoglobulin heavy chain junction region [Macaca mulatta]MOV40423.1 immunoglobulin heavy chain junction region [Macaca mulatta]MOV41637.1 immunoglobulin heavy chain junction region [Macaca mulatta]MOV41884.1 immunoglobulin heavy chain junction region [Macaca mulatta]MOV42380.1 immunoglobulin heavy chain junction region [Macaca mulatta]